MALGKKASRSEDIPCPKDPGQGEFRFVHVCCMTINGATLRMMASYIIAHHEPRHAGEAH